MMGKQVSDRHDIMKDLGEGLVLRRGTTHDAEQMATFQGDMHREPGAQDLDLYIAAWVRDLMSRPHPTFEPADFLVVEEVKTGTIVSASCLISQTWAYDGIPFEVGRPELIATLPKYRRQGLIRTQFDILHRWSADRGQMVQAITGIPWYYRQFGYEMVLNLGGARFGYQTQVPKLKDGEQEPFQVRPATEADLPFITRTAEHSSRPSLITCKRDASLWRHEMTGISAKSIARREICIIESLDRQPVGFFVYSPILWHKRITAGIYELKEGVSWLAVTPTVVRHLWAQGQELAKQTQGKKLVSFGFLLGERHPVYEVFDRRLPHTVKPYAYFLRVPDLPGFLRHITPILEQRLAGSVAVGHSGELRISQYRGGIRLAFEEGKVSMIEPWQATAEQWGDAAFPDLTFLQLVLGYRSLEELSHAFSDCWTEDDTATTLLNALFPKIPSDFLPLS